MDDRDVIGSSNDDSISTVLKNDFDAFSISQCGHDSHSSKSELICLLQALLFADMRKFGELQSWSFY